MNAPPLALHAPQFHLLCGYRDNSRSTLKAEKGRGNNRKQFSEQMGGHNCAAFLPISFCLPLFPYDTQFCKKGKFRSPHTFLWWVVGIRCKKSDVTVRRFCGR
uniref:Uncharacterized protein n=1 Tax=Trypanosoma vivax (strain Y486) TaxID=1055687 RepID=G0TZ55_TRYVY|nr:hypothetical protein TVY486_0705820 [Trypanosoma vivax Y486]